MTRKSRRRRLGSALVALLLVLAAGFGTSASAAESTPPESGPKLPQLDGATGAATGLAASVRAGKAKLSIALSAVTATAYAFPPYRQPASGYVRAKPEFLPERPDPNCDYYVSDSPIDIYVDEIDQPDSTKLGTLRSVGKFRDTSVSMLAFGGVPVTAVLHASQIRHGSTAVPLLADEYGFPKSVQMGAGDAGAAGCDPVWEANVPTFGLASGQIVVRVSDVRVDGRSIDVGNSCRPVRALKLNLTGVATAHGGEFRTFLAPGVIVQRKDTGIVNPANPIAIAPGSSNLTIPPFDNCVGKDGEDVSRLITGLVSGPDNTVSVNLGAPVVPFDFDPVHPTKCGTSETGPGCVVLPPHVNPPAPGR